MSTVVRKHTCPACGGTVVYNGNYFCQDLDTGGPCTWVMNVDEELTMTEYKIVRDYLIQERDDATQAGNLDRAARMQFYLDAHEA